MAALSVLLAAVAEDGHVAPLLAVAQGLIERGHRVRFLTGAAFRTAIEGVGAEFLPWPDDAEVDHRAFIAAARNGGRRTTGLAGLALVVEGAFLPPAAGNTARSSRRSPSRARMRSSSSPRSSVRRRSC